MCVAHGGSALNTSRQLVSAKKSTPVYGGHQGCLPVEVGDVDICAFSDENLHYSLIGSLAGPVEWRLSVLVPTVYTVRVVFQLLFHML